MVCWLMLGWAGSIVETDHRLDRAVVGLASRAEDLRTVAAVQADPDEHVLSASNATIRVARHRVVLQSFTDPLHSGRHVLGRVRAAWMSGSACMHIWLHKLLRRQKAMHIIHTCDTPPVDCITWSSA